MCVHTPFPDSKLVVYLMSGVDSSVREGTWSKCDMEQRTVNESGTTMWEPTPNEYLSGPQSCLCSVPWELSSFWCTMYWFFYTWRVTLLRCIRSWGQLGTRLYVSHLTKQLNDQFEDFLRVHQLGRPQYFLVSVYPRLFSVSPTKRNIGLTTVVRPMFLVHIRKDPRIVWVSKGDFPEYVVGRHVSN